MTYTPATGYSGPDSFAYVALDEMLASSAATVSISVVAPPESTVAALPAVTNSTSFTVSWSGTDSPGGGGIVSYSIYESKDGGAFTALLTNTTKTSTTFTGAFGHTYGFYSVATDAAGFTQATPAQGEGLDHAASRDRTSGEQPVGDHRP